ncbi:MAG: large ribosomal subunit protein bL35 [Bacillota bacterium]
MAYKLKPNKSMLSRFKVTKTGKLKFHHAKTSHLQSARSSKTKRRLGRPAVLFEGNARNLRRLMGAGHLNPARTAHLRALAAKEAAQPAAAETK